VRPALLAASAPTRTRTTRRRGRMMMILRGSRALG
jgi:hypothetical protein